MRVRRLCPALQVLGYSDSGNASAVYDGTVKIEVQRSTWTSGSGNKKGEQNLVGAFQRSEEGQSPPQGSGYKATEKSPTGTTEKRIRRIRAPRENTKEKKQRIAGSLAGRKWLG